MAEEQDPSDDTANHGPEAPEAPVLPCPRCDELDTRQQAARAAHDRSALVDVRVLTREHAWLGKCERARDVIRTYGATVG
ncbi:hypothetical protein GCM10010442_40650 [Kitasatospora kifunensis]|uniref:Uncharacterized protein n=1 Tax=Kitasatospora kifunensis TaxID=58351 RepID=A0A7W7VXS5_KITKI|nr:hypothetical protein [Kitasatospora kifunensis]